METICIINCSHTHTHTHTRTHAHTHTRHTHATHTPHTHTPTPHANATHTPHTRHTHATHTPHTRHTHATHATHTRHTHTPHTHDTTQHNTHTHDVWSPVLSEKKKKICLLLFNSFPASGNFCHLLITFANSLDPDQAKQNVWPDLDPLFDTLMIFLKEFFSKLINP